MSEVPAAVLKLRIRALFAIASASGLHPDETTIRFLAERNSDEEVMAELRRRQSKPPWWTSLFVRRNPH